MNFQHFAGAAYRALTARKDGPSLYDVCDPLLLKYRGGEMLKTHGKSSRARRCRFRQATHGRKPHRPRSSRTSCKSLKNYTNSQKIQM